MRKVIGLVVGALVVGGGVGVAAAQAGQTAPEPVRLVSPAAESQPVDVETTEPAPVETTTAAPAPVETTEPAPEPPATSEPVDTIEPVKPQPKPKPETPRRDLIPDPRGPEYPPTDPNTPPADTPDPRPAVPAPAPAPGGVAPAP